MGKKFPAFSPQQILIVILFIAAFVRFWNLGVDLPSFYYPDEQTYVNKSAAFGSGDLNPHFFNYPTFYMYVSFFFFGIFFLAGKLVGVFPDVASFQHFFFFHPSPFYLITRLISALSGIGAVYMTYRVGKDWRGKKTGLIAAILISLCYLHVRQSHFGVADVPTSFLAITALWVILKIPDLQGKLWHKALWGGLIAGLATSTKYHAIYLIGSILAAGIILWIKQRHFENFLRTLFISGTAMGLGYFIGSPYSIIDWATFTNNFERIFLMTLNSKELGITEVIWFIMRYGFGFFLSFLFFAAVIKDIIQKDRKSIILMAFVIPFIYFFLGKTGFNIIHYAAPIAPVLCLLVAGLLAHLLAHKRLVFKISGLLLLTATIVESSQAIYHENIRRARVDTRTLARQWIETHVPSGETVAYGGISTLQPHVFESRRTLQEKLEYVQKEGIRTKGDYSNIFATPRHFLTKLAMSDYPPAPYYHRIDIYPQGFGPEAKWILSEMTVKALKKKKTRAIIFAEAPFLPLVSEATALERRVQRIAQEVVTFTPEAIGPREEIYDDAGAGNLIPVARQRNMKRFGPDIRIYLLPE